MRNHSDYARSAVRVWMRAVMDDRGWTANEWANMAGTSPTNITRFLSPTSKIMPSVDTICKLAMIARTQPNLVPGVAQEAKPPCNYCPECGFDLRAVTPQPPGRRRRPAA